MDNGPGKDGQSEPPPVISSLAHACNSAFTRLCQNLPTTDYHGLEAKATDEAGRFKVWAANIGALQRPQSSGSLDSRLKNAERMKSSVISGLQRLEDALANGIALGNIPNRTKSPVIDEESISHSLGLLSGNASERNRVSSATEIDELFDNIRSCITHLFTLSTLLRRSHPRGRIARQGPQYSQSDPRPFITNAQDKFPKLKQSPWLAERIGQRNARQIDYIRYRQNHRRNLAQVEDGPVDDEQAERATTKATSFHETLAAPESIRKDSPGLTSEESIYTIATSFAQTAVGDNYSGRVVPQLTRMWLDGRQLDYGEPIECPYCRTIQVIRDRYHWRHHVYRDLQAYICTFEDCSAEPFQTSHEWFKHELDKHRRQWKCALCHAKCVSASALEAHFDSRHPGVVSAAQRRVMLKACEKPVTHFDKNACPLCDSWNPSSIINGNSDKFRSHLAKHFQELACEAIPLAIEGLVVQDDSDTDHDTTTSDGDDHGTEDE
ncbi:ankyrin repeat protein [Colletotrichum tabaci]|uniref:Ankyrin repeat protein n=1 Tax=Colletotrichum tabaci TaxID=1209068 RepID=A0AAV9TMZ8_9PEZI